MLQYTKKLNPAVFVPTFFLVILEIAKTFSSILLPQYFIDDITNRSSIRQTMFHLAILIIAIFGMEYLKTKKKYDLSCRKFSIFSILINFLLFSFLTSFVVYVIYKDIIQIDEAVLVITAAVSLSSISEQFSNAFSDLMKSGTFVTDFRTCVNLSLKKEAENQNKPFLSENKSRMEIVFDHVSFRYPGKEQYILQDFSLKIHAGEKIAIVGLNGSGKTTLVKLLCNIIKTTASKPSNNCLTLLLFSDFSHHANRLLIALYR